MSRLTNDDQQIEGHRLMREGDEIVWCVKLPNSRSERFSKLSAEQARELGRGFKLAAQSPVDLAVKLEFVKGPPALIAIPKPTMLALADKLHSLALSIMVEQSIRETTTVH